MCDEDDGEAGDQKEINTLIQIIKKKRKDRKKQPYGFSDNELMNQRETPEGNLETQELLHKQTSTIKSNQVPLSKPKPKSKKQKAAEQRRRDREMAEIASEIADKVKQEEERSLKRKQAELEKQKRLEEERARQAAEEKKQREKTAELKALKEKQREERERLEEEKRKKEDKKKKAAAGKPKQAAEQQKAEDEQSQLQRTYPLREVPPRFAHKQHNQQQKHQKMSGQRKPGGDANIGHWTGWEACLTQAAPLPQQPDHSPAAQKRFPPNHNLMTKNCVWSGPEANRINDSQEPIGTWQNPDGAWGSNTKPSSNDIIVDTQDKEAWPSIGDHSESASDGGDADNASVKSVISSSSNPGQVDSTGQGTSAIKGQSASNVWGANTSSTYGSNNGPWGTSPGSSQINSLGWAGNPNSNSQSVNNQGPNMQNSAVTSNANNPNSLGWGNGPQNSMQGSGGNTNSNVQGAIPTSGAQNGNNGPHMSGTQPTSTVSNAMSWQGINYTSSEGGLKDQAANGSSTWGNTSEGSSVIGSGLNNNNLSMSTAGSNSMDNKNVDQWRGSTGSLGWGDQPRSEKSESSGWGSPPAGDGPVSSAGTDAWGKPNSQQMIPQAWGGSNTQGNQSTQGSGWGQPDNNKNSTSSWGQTNAKSTPPSSGWGDSGPARPNQSGWGQPDKAATSVWGNDNANRSQSQWGMGAGAANPQSQWGGGDGAGAAGGNPQGNAWGNNNQSKSWAQAAGQGIQNKPGTPESDTAVEQPPPPILSPKEAMIHQVINSSDGWGKKPICQDTSWDTEEPPRPPQVPPPRRNSGGEQDSNHWTQAPQNKNGTAIWEASKEQNTHWSGGQGGHSGGGNGSNRGGASSSNEWAPDSDVGTWSGPPGSGGQGAGSSSNHWNGPPPNNNNPGGNGNHWGGQWGADRGDRGSWGSSGPSGGSSLGSGSNGSDRGGNKGNTWGTDQKEDNVWDRNGTSAWGQGSSKTETGTWESRRRGSSSSNWCDDSVGSNAGGPPQGWDPGSQRGRGPPGPPGQTIGSDVDNGTAFWGDPNSQSKPAQSWMSGPPPGSMPPHGMPPHHQPPPQMPRQDSRDDRMWGAPPPSNPGSWGEPSPPVNRVDDSSSFWGQSNPQANKGGWSENSGHWPGAKPKTSSTPGWGEPNEWNTARKMGDAMPPGWGEDGGGGGGGGGSGDPDMINWDGSQESSSSWTSARQVRKPQGAIYSVAGGRHPPQMRSKLLQQLVEMGFKREDAQNALISNNMNMESAIADLVAGANRMNMDQDDKSGRKLQRMPDGIPETDANQFVPPMPNTPFSNAQSIPNSQQVIANPLNKGPSLQNISSLNSTFNNSTSISPSLQQKIIQHQMAQQNLPPQGQAIRGQMSAQSVQQQIAVQQQIMQQLRMAVQAGLISPQLLNQQLTPNLRVMVQQLLQLQETHQRLVSHQQLLQQQMLQKGQPANPIAQRQLEQLTITIPKIKQQVYQLQQQITVQQAHAKQPITGDASKELIKDMSNMNLKPEQAIIAQQQLQQQQHQQQQQQQQHQQQQQSRLTQWKLPSPDKDGSESNLNKAPGSKPSVQQSHSTSNLQANKDPGTGLPFSDSTWSTLSPSSTSTRDWPTSTAASSATTTTTVSDAKDSSANNSAESTPASDTKESPTAAVEPAAGSEGSAVSDMGIPEFVPGKPWQGLANKNVEDDPYLTPGSVSRPSLSVNTIKGEYVMTTLGKSSSPSVSDSTTTTPPNSSSSWSSFGGLATGRSGTNLAASKNTWSSSNSLSESSALASELWGVPQRNTRPPPGLTNQTKSGSWQQQQQPINRSVSWAPGDHASGRGFGAPGQISPSWGGNVQISSCLVLKNLTPQIEGSTLKTLCTQHGPLQAFYLNFNSGQALVRYNTKEEALKAQKSLNTCMLNNTTILAEFVSEAEAMRLLEHPNSGNQAPTVPTPATPPNMPTSSWSHGPQPAYNYRSNNPQYTTAKQDSSHWNGATALGGMWGSGSGLWGVPDDHNPLMSGDLLGGQPM